MVHLHSAAHVGRNTDNVFNPIRRVERGERQLDSRKQIVWTRDRSGNMTGPVSV